jgi:hypothetical protein
MSDAPEEVPIETIKKEMKKPKKPQTEKQKESFQKALTALKAKRESQKKNQEDEAEMLKAEGDEVKLQAKKREYFEKAKVSRRKLPPPSDRPVYVTAAELQKFKLELLDQMMPVKVVKTREVEVPVETIVEKKVVVEKIVEKPTTKVITGNELLDRIFKL